MDAADLFLKCLVQATAVVKQVRPEQFAGDTPDTEWTVRDLVGHMLYELSWVPDIVAGKTIAEVGDKYDRLLGDDEDDIDLAVLWQGAADRAEAAVNDADLDEIAHLSYGDYSNEHYLREAAADQLIHAWDLAEGIGMVIRFDSEVAQDIYDRVQPDAATMHETGLFAPPVDVSADADIQTKLLALYGRRTDWR